MKEDVYYPKKEHHQKSFAESSIKMSCSQWVCTKCGKRANLTYPGPPENYGCIGFPAYHHWIKD